MLGIYVPNPNLTEGWEVKPLFISDSAWYVTKKYDGNDILTFEIETDHVMYKYIEEEIKVLSEDNRYVIKSIDQHSTFATIQCNLDYEDWQQTVYREYRRTYSNIRKILEELLPTGWSYNVDSSLTSKVTTVEGNEGEALKVVTPYDILSSVADAYSCVFNFDIVNKKLYAIDPTVRTASGIFFTDELNLKSIGYTGSSDGFATRLYAYGKVTNDVPLTFASINNGKEYIEDFSYSDKVICVGWSDERYTIKENLLADAKERLKQLAAPSRSYTCDVKYLPEDIELYDIVTLIDRQKKTRVNHQVVEYKKCKTRELSSITLSKLQPTITSVVSSSTSQVRQDLVQQTAEVQQLIETSVDYAMQQITGSNGGNVQIIYNTQGQPYQILWLIDSDSLTDVSKLFCFDEQGLRFSQTGYSGTYTTIIDANGKINPNVFSGTIKDNSGNSWNLSTGKAVFDTDTTLGGKTISQWINGIDIPEQQTITKDTILQLLLDSDTTTYTGIIETGDKRFNIKSGLIQSVETISTDSGGETA